MGESPLPSVGLPPDVIFARPITPPSLATPEAPLTLPTLPRRAAVLGLGFVLLLLLAMVLVSGAVWLGFYAITHATEPSDEALVPLIAVDKWINAALTLGALLFFARYHRLTLRAFGIRCDHAGRQAAWGLAALGGVYGALLLSVVFTIVLVALWPELEPDLASRLRFLELMSGGGFLGTVLMLVPVAIHEEILFRGLLMPLLHRLGGPWSVAVVISTLVFAALHVSQGWLAIPQVFLVGLALSLFFLWSRSLLAVIVAHFLFDLLQLQLAQVMLPFMERAAGS